MKSKIVIAAALLGVISTSKGEVVVNEFLYLQGFIDMSYTHFNGEADVSGASNVQEEDNKFGIEEVEITFLFDFNPVTALIDFEYEENGKEFEVEQAFITYSLNGNLQGLRLIAGRYASMLGFEAYERIWRYQYSTAYESSLLGNFIGGNLFDNLLTSSELDVFLSSDAFIFFESVLFPVGERYSQGVKYTYESDNIFFGVSIQDGTLSYGNSLGGGNAGDNAGDDTVVDDGGYGFEIAYAYNFVSGLTYFLGGSYEKGDGLDTVIDPSSSSILTLGGTETYVVNTYATYEIGAWLFALELNYSETEMDAVFASSNDSDFESLTGLVMTNYAYDAQASVTGRIGFTDLSADLQGVGNTAAAQILKYTVAHNYAVTENLLFVTELSYSEGDFHSNVDSSSDLEELFVAVQILFNF